MYICNLKSQKDQRRLWISELTCWKCPLSRHKRVKLPLNRIIGTNKTKSAASHQHLFHMSHFDPHTLWIGANMCRGESSEFPLMHLEQTLTTAGHFFLPTFPLFLSFFSVILLPRLKTSCCWIFPIVLKSDADGWRCAGRFYLLWRWCAHSSVQSSLLFGLWRM